MDLFSPFQNGLFERHMVWERVSYMGNIPI